jgi:hypothetical protein
MSEKCKQGTEKSEKHREQRNQRNANSEERNQRNLSQGGRAAGEGSHRERPDAFCRGQVHCGAAARHLAVERRSHGVLGRPLRPGSAQREGVSERGVRSRSRARAASERGRAGCSAGDR